eukprot:TRINITY_DN10887_c0_g1_i1.p1 TRINITY_DN10887_c0_g1~~TRINITY_DN10887_c0_g1_i1.p1  ORF type:complete len:694 (-),score=219.41 TRINITY_DN10887_c0_g1_i1:208-2289(-)
MFFQALFVFANLISLSRTGLAKTWAPTQCGFSGGNANIITQWGKQVDPNNVLPEYPRPQMTRPNVTWQNLNGLWEFQPGSASDQPPFGQQLSGTILVPFPVESCLSGVGQNHQYLWYRLVFNVPGDFSASRVLLHFGAVDWQTTVWLNKVQLGNHTGGYDGFSFDISAAVEATNNELLVFVYDPSELGYQPNGKQRISAMTNPGGDVYTPSSGIWQTVWLENVPEQYIGSVRVLADTRSLTVSAEVVGAPNSEPPLVTFAISNGSAVVATASAPAGQQVTVYVPQPHLWDPSDPFLYDLEVSIATDSVGSYFGMRSIELGKEQQPPTPPTGPQFGIDRPGADLPGYPVTLAKADPSVCEAMCANNSQCTAWAYGVPGSACNNEAALCWLKSGFPSTTANACRVSGDMGLPARIIRRPYLNGGFLFLAGWLDQSFWPDGQYTAPTDEALAFDIQAVKTYGLNTIRLHQKVNPERWYYHADRLGVVVLQDMVQKYGGASAATVPVFIQDLQAMIAGRYNHPCIIQWETFNEGDCVDVFNATQVVELVQALDPSRLVDTNSGGPANNLYIADVNDIHTYPYPGHPLASDTQYAMVGEYGGIGAFVAGHEWNPGQCQTYLHVNTPADEADTYIAMVGQLQSFKTDVSCCIYTQITDLEMECDGILNYDRTAKFDANQTAFIVAANQKLIYGSQLPVA